MSYVVLVERNYETLKNCISSTNDEVPLRPHHIKTPADHYMEIAKRLERRYDLKVHFRQESGALVWDSLEFHNEQAYLLWTLKFG